MRTPRLPVLSAGARWWLRSAVWGLVAVVMGVALGALAGVSVLAIGQWVLGQVMSEPYQQ